MMVDRHFEVKLHSNIYVSIFTSRLSRPIITRNTRSKAHKQNCVQFEYRSPLYHAEIY